MQGGLGGGGSGVGAGGGQVVLCACQRAEMHRQGRQSGAIVAEKTEGSGVVDRGSALCSSSLNFLLFTSAFNDKRLDNFKVFQTLQHFFFSVFLFFPHLWKQ